MYRRPERTTTHALPTTKEMNKTIPSSAIMADDLSWVLSHHLSPVARTSRHQLEREGANEVAQRKPWINRVFGPEHYVLLVGGVHATKAVARPVVNASTLGFGAPVLSTIEDVIALTTSLVAVFLPFVVLAFVALFGAGAYWIWSRRRAKRAALTTG